jgi:hypothetical protein
MMKTLVALWAALVVGLTLATPANAAPNPEAAALSPGDRFVSDPSADPASSGDLEQGRVVTGRVLKVDANEGTLVIQTPMGLIALRGPAEELRGVAVGDVVEVEVIGDEDAPSASPRMDANPGDEE